MSPRPHKFRFYLDENFSAPAGKFLRSLGHNVFHVVSDKKLRSLGDFHQLREARRQERVFVALDKDFRVDRSLRSEIEKGFGVILISSGDPRSEKVVEVLNLLMEKISTGKLKGRLCRASMDKIIFESLEF